jgi:hypothetical protein
MIPSVCIATVARDLGSQQFRLLLREYEGATGPGPAPPRVPDVKEVGRSEVNYPSLKGGACH